MTALQYTAPIGASDAFLLSDSLTRPANTNTYGANKSLNCNLTVTAVAYTGTTVTLTSNGHPLAVGDRITVAGVNAGGTFTNINGNWVVSVITTNTFSFEVSATPTGTTPQTGLTITGAIAKMLSIAVASTPGGLFRLYGMSLICGGVAMLGAMRVHVLDTQITTLVDEATFTLLVANKAYHQDYFDLTPITEGSGSNATLASWRGDRVFKCAAGDTRVYFQLSTAAATPTAVSGGVITVQISGVKM